MYLSIREASFHDRIGSILRDDRCRQWTRCSRDIRALRYGKSRRRNQRCSPGLHHSHDEFDRYQTAYGWTRNIFAVFVITLTKVLPRYSSVNVQALYRFLLHMATTTHTRDKASMLNFIVISCLPEGIAQWCTTWGRDMRGTTKKKLSGPQPTPP